MKNQDDLKALKKRLSAQLLSLEGVRGVGIGAGRLRVYLRSDAVKVRRRVERLLAEEAPDVEIDVVETETFRKHARAD